MASVKSEKVGSNALLVRRCLVLLNVVYVFCMTFERGLKNYLCEIQSFCM